jgi:ADP-ribose pyrophosphatase YjhB (NUDIX family)
MRTRARIVLETPFEAKALVACGLAVFAVSSKRCLLVQRKHSVEYILLLKGNYRPSYIYRLLEGCRSSERDKIKLMLIEGESEYIREYDNTFQKHNYSGWSMLSTYSQLILRLINYLGNLELESELQWTFPKGGIKYKEVNNDLIRESPLICAKREFKEETGIALPANILFLPHATTVKQYSYAGKVVETLYWKCMIADEFAVNPDPNSKEVSNCAWLSWEEIINKISEDNIPCYQEIINEFLALC